ncbi:restriction endonuclease subunit S [Nocardia sp. NPDC050412]|uniref:restriction endonuclease subunit S n=1 Tax=Nocardia sp. NPDC050412 TaxID=3364320 RepID=UPI0037A2B60D
MSDASATPTLRVKQMATKIGSGKTPSGGSETYRDSGVMFLRSQNIHFGGLNLTDVAYIDDLTHREMHGTRVRERDVLLNITGASLGRVTYFRAGLGEANVNQHVCIIRPRSSTDPRYLAYALSSNVCQDQIFGMQVGGNRDGLNFEQVGGLEIPAPLLEEQRRIADFLDAETSRMDRLCELRSAQRSLADARLNAIWSTAIVADGDDFSWVPIRRFVIAITDGPFGSALTSSHYSDSGARVIRLGNIGRADFRERDAAYIPMEYFRTLGRHHARPGDLVVAGLGDQGNPLGRACVVPDGIGPAMVKADCFRLRLDQARVMHDYAAWAMSSPPVSEQAVLLSRGSTRSRINLEVVRDVRIPVPPLSRQLETVDLLAKARQGVNQFTSKCDKQLTLLAERRQSLITAAVTGEFDVTTASGRNLTQGV